jgi:hypothetical protein
VVPQGTLVLLATLVLLGIQVLQEILAQQAIRERLCLVGILTHSTHTIECRLVIRTHRTVEEAEVMIRNQAMVRNFTMLI